MKNPLSFSPKEQMQMSLIALCGMIIMLIGLAIFSILYVIPELNLSGRTTNIFKWMVGINTFFGALFLSSSFIGVYQQYKLINSVEQLGAPTVEFEAALPDIFKDMKGGNK